MSSARPVPPDRRPGGRRGARLPVRLRRTGTTAGRPSGSTCWSAAAARRDSSADLLLKQALLEVDKKTILDQLTPEFLNLTKMIEQADANVKPSALLGIGLLGRLRRPAMLAAGW